MPLKVQRFAPDLTSFPDLVVIYLGMRVNRLTGLKLLLGMGRPIVNAVGQRPDGLLSHQFFLWSMLPLHLGIRQYWRDFDALERWARSDPHRVWWHSFPRDTGGTGFWHETYLMRGGMEAIYDDIPERQGFASFAPLVQPRGSMFSARTRAQIHGDAVGAPPIVESAVYDGPVA